MFTGRQFDEESGLYSYRARYYDSLKGRFLTRDPLRSAAGVNLYEYAGGNPLRFADPLGLQATFPGLKVTFKDCNCAPWNFTPAQQNTIAKQISDNCFTMQTALKNLGNISSYTPTTGAGKTKLNAINSGNNLQRLKDILAKALKEACGDLTVECECSCSDPDTQAYTRGSTWGSWANLHLCPPFLKAKGGAAEQQKTLLHEMTHYGGSSDDVDTDDLNAHNLENLLPWLENLFPPAASTTVGTAGAGTAAVGSTGTGTAAGGSAGSGTGAGGK
jgi:RHS repeat-associated protein